VKHALARSVVVFVESVHEFAFKTVRSARLGSAARNCRTKERSAE
jgi:hypothetical protein